MKITQLTAENVKRIEAVSINPDGSVVVIGGKNGAGKSSVLDAILFALSGASSLPGKPVREGADEATIRVTLSNDEGGGYIVVRKIKADGKTSLDVRHEVEPGVTSKVTSPQKLLDALVGKIAFDPLAFTRMRPADQVETLRGIVGVDTTDIDRQIDAKFSERSDANRDVKRLEGLVESLPKFDDAPEEEQSPNDVLDELERA